MTNEQHQRYTNEQMIAILEALYKYTAVLDRYFPQRIQREQWFFLHEVWRCEVCSEPLNKAAAANIMEKNMVERGESVGRRTVNSRIEQAKKADLICEERGSNLPKSDSRSIYIKPTDNLNFAVRSSLCDLMDMVRIAVENAAAKGAMPQLYKNDT